MRNIYITLCLIFISISSYGQGKKYVFLEAGGSSTIAAVNFDMRFKKEAINGLGFRVGLGNSFGLFESKDIKDVLLVPVGLNYVFGEKKNAFVVGINTTVAIMGEKKGYESPLIISPEVGYRFRPETKGLGFHVSYAPLFNTVDGTMPLWLGAGIGYSW